MGYNHYCKNYSKNHKKYKSSSASDPESKYPSLCWWFSRQKRLWNTHCPRQVMMNKKIDDTNRLSRHHYCSTIRISNKITFFCIPPIFCTKCIRIEINLRILK